MIAAILAIEDDDQRRLVEQWYRKYYKIMRKKAYDIVQDLDVANDMVNEAFIKIINNFEKISTLNCSEMLCYFVGTIRSVSIDYIRKQKAGPEITKEDFEELMEDNLLRENFVKSPEEIFINNESIEIIAKALEKLNEREAMLLVKKYYLGSSNKEIEKSLGIKEEYVHVYVKRAYIKLLKIINGDENYEK